MTISLEKFTELAHRTASRYSHRSDQSKIAYTFLPHTLEDFHRQVGAESEAAVKQARIDALEEAKQAVDDETLTDPQDASDDAYNAAVYDCVQAIRSLKETP